MGNILKCCCLGKDDRDDHYTNYYPTSSPPWYYQQPGVPVPLPSREQQTPPGSHGDSHSDTDSDDSGGHGVVVPLEYDLLNFQATSMVPEGLGEYVKSSKKAQVEWYRNIWEAYCIAENLPRTSVEAAMLVATALSRIQRDDLEGVLNFYGFAVPTVPVVTPEHDPSSLPDGVQYVLNTLPVNAKCIGDGDGFTAYVDTADSVESTNIPVEVRDAVTALAQARKYRNKKMKNVLRNKIIRAGYRIIDTSEDEILARKCRFRLRGIDAPEIEQQHGKESQDALVKLIAGKSVVVHVYGQDRYKRYVGDIYCDGVFIQEQMLQKGHVWHYKHYDKRPEFAKWEKNAQDASRGLWASDNPEKPWEWRWKRRNARHVNTTTKV